MDDTETKRPAQWAPQAATRGDQETAAQPPAAALPPYQSFPHLDPGAWGRGGARLRSEDLRQQLGLDRLEPVRTGRARPPARDSAPHKGRRRLTTCVSLRLFLPLPSLWRVPVPSRPPPRGPRLCARSLFRLGPLDFGEREKQ